VVVVAIMNTSIVGASQKCDKHRCMMSGGRNKFCDDDDDDDDDAVSDCEWQNKFSSSVPRPDNDDIAVAVTAIILVFSFCIITASSLPEEDGSGDGDGISKAAGLVVMLLILS
jgi:hypothetical protein